jgi:hypothetical protein
VFLHHLLWEDDRHGFRGRIEQFLDIAGRHAISVMPVLFDSCFDPEPRLGPQRVRQGVHNSAWVQCPGRERLADSSRYGQLEEYARGVVAAFGSDQRVVGWDVWNEPSPEPVVAGGMFDEAPAKAELTLALLDLAFDWVRAESPAQPLTSGVFGSGRSWTAAELLPVERVQLDRSDVVSFHCYEPADGFAARIEQLRAYGRPLLCTEYLARPYAGIVDVLPMAQQAGVGMYNWGLVSGRSQTKYPYDSWQQPYTDEPAVWLHDLLHPDGTPYRTDETDLLRSLTGGHHVQ